MEFNKKLQELRKQKGYTQEELADVLFVSRAAISKWESGRGYPNIDSLKAISKIFSISVDELLSSNELLIIAEEDNKKKETQFSNLLFGFLDIFTSFLLFLPFFAQKEPPQIYSVPLFSLTPVSSYLKVTYFIIIFSLIFLGILTLALQNCTKLFWTKLKRNLSLIFNILGIFIFILSLQPYAAILLFIFLMLKILSFVKK